MADETTDFLYPMIDGGASDVDALVTDLAASAREKSATSSDTTVTALEQWGDELDLVARKIAERRRDGGRLFTFGNGGSATDAEGVASLFGQPPHGEPMAARSLVADVSILTALANDVGFDIVFSRQLIAHGTEHDVALGFSTSGNSTNVIRAFEHAHAKGMLTIGLAGSDGGAMATCDDLDHCFVVASQSVHRIQEAQSAMSWVLWERVQEHVAAMTSTGVPTHTRTKEAS